MHELLEILFEMIFEVSGALSMGSHRMKTGVKTAMFATVGGVITLVCVTAALLCWNQENQTLCIVFAVISFILLICTIAGAVKGHKCKWDMRGS